MVRTQVQLSEEQARKLRRLAAQQGVSISEVVRRFIDLGLRERMPDRASLYERATGMVGRYRDAEGATDVADEHDAYLDRAFD